MAKFSKKHYEEIAKVFSQVTSPSELATDLHIALVLDFAAMLYNDNKRFDSDKFIEACGVILSDV